MARKKKLQMAEHDSTVGNLQLGLPKNDHGKEPKSNHLTLHKNYHGAGIVTNIHPKNHPVMWVNIQAPWLFAYDFLYLRPSPCKFGAGISTSNHCGASELCDVLLHPNDLYIFHERESSLVILFDIACKHLGRSQTLRPKRNISVNTVNQFLGFTNNPIYIHIYIYIIYIYMMI